MAVINFTDKALKALTKRKRASKERHFDAFDDDSLSGLGVNVSMRGGVNFFIMFVSPENGKRRTVALGEYPSVSLSEARKKGRVLYAKVKQGVDPIEDEIREEAEAEALTRTQNTGTLRDLIDVYILKQQKYGAAGQHEKIRRMINKDLPDGHHLLDKKANEVTSKDIAAILGQCHARGKPKQANELRKCFTAAFSFARKVPFTPEWAGLGIPDFGLTYNPVDAIPKATGEAVMVVSGTPLQPVEINYFWHNAGVDALSADYALCLKLLLATGQRVQEVLHASKSEFDFKERLWIIPAWRRKVRGKVSSDQVIPLTDLHLHLLKKIFKLSGDSPWLFPNPDNSKTHRIESGLRLALRRFCIPPQRINGKDVPNPSRKRMNYWTPSECRTTVATLAGEAGLTLDEIAVIGWDTGGRGSTVVSKHYNFLEAIKVRRVAMKKWTSYLQGVIDGKNLENVRMLSRSSVKPKAAGASS